MSFCTLSARFTRRWLRSSVSLRSNSSSRSSVYWEDGHAEQEWLESKGAAVERNYNWVIHREYNIDRLFFIYIFIFITVKSYYNVEIWNNQPEEPGSLIWVQHPDSAVLWKKRGSPATGLLSLLSFFRGRNPSKKNTKGIINNQRIRWLVVS